MQNQLTTIKNIARDAYRARESGFSEEVYKLYLPAPQSGATRQAGGLPPDLPAHGPHLQSLAFLDPP